MIHTVQSQAAYTNSYGYTRQVAQDFECRVSDTGLTVWVGNDEYFVLDSDEEFEGLIAYLRTNYEAYKDHLVTVIPT